MGWFDIFGTRKGFAKDLQNRAANNVEQQAPDRHPGDFSALLETANANREILETILRHVAKCEERIGEFGEDLATLFEDYKDKPDPEPEVPERPKDARQVTVIGGFLPAVWKLHPVTREGLSSHAGALVVCTVQRGSKYVEVYGMLYVAGDGKLSVARVDAGQPAVPKVTYPLTYFQQYYLAEWESV